jgi:CBS domain-containing protein
LFNAPSIGHALMDLTKRDVVSHFALKDFMIPLNEAPKVSENATAMEVLESIEKGGLGFTLVLNEENYFNGLCSNADIRKALLKFEGNVTNRTVKELMNQQPISIQETKTVNDLMNLVKSYSFPISYLPVLNNDGKAVGIVTFVNLIKGEL